MVYENVTFLKGSMGLAYKNLHEMLNFYSKCREITIHGSFLSKIGGRKDTEMWKNNLFVNMFRGPFFKRISGNIPVCLFTGNKGTTLNTVEATLNK